MIRYGVAPFLECSSKGDRRFSAFYARPKSLNGRSIEEAYQGMKVFDSGMTNLHWKEAKGRHPTNKQECVASYDLWWKQYIDENGLLSVLKSASGLSDIFGKEGSVCQAEVLWRIRNGDL